MYKSPIEMIYGELQTQMVQEDEKMVMKAIRKVGVNVDKEELIKALQYDRNQYTRGYEDGKNDAIDEISAEIEQKIIKRPYMDFKEWERCHNDTILEVLDIIDKYKAESEGINADSD